MTPGREVEADSLAAGSGKGGGKAEKPRWQDRAGRARDSTGFHVPLPLTEACTSGAAEA